MTATAKNRDGARVAPPTLGVFGRHAPDYASVGLRPFPVHTRDKRPAVRNWRDPSDRAVSAWAKRFANADGLGVNMGLQSGVTEIDVDAVGAPMLALATESFGETPIVIQTASGKSKLWYRHNGESRRIRPFGADVPIDVLGNGYTIAPPSHREDLGASYRFLQGGLEDLKHLPPIRPNALGDLDPATVLHGARNVSLWRWCMMEARRCDDAEALIDAAETWAAAMPDRLPLSEVRAAALSAWGYETKGRNFLGLKRPQVTWEDQMQDQLADAPDAFFLLAMFRRWHSSRPSFAIAPSAMSEAHNPPWHRTRIAKARDVLLERGALVEISPPVRGRAPGRYRLAVSHGGEGVL